MKKITSILGAAALGMTVASQPAVADDSYVPILGLLAGMLNVGVFPESDKYTTDDNITIYASDGVNLEANIFVPKNIQGSAPAVVLINSWGLGEYEYLKQAGDLANKGYIVLSYATRGFGTSGGYINTAGPKDISDLRTIIDYLIAHYPVNPNAIGAGGISYGSGISLIGAAHDKRIKAVAAMSSWGSLTDSLYGNNTPRKVWGELLTMAGDLTGNPDPVESQYWSYIRDQNASMLPTVLNWASVRSPATYVSQLNTNKTAVYLAKSYGDDLFQPNSLMDMFARLTGPKHVDLTAGTHATAEVLPWLVGLGDDLVWRNVNNWFDLHLKGQANAMSTAAPVAMKVKFQNRYDQFSAWPIAQAKSKNWYLHPRSVIDTGDLEATTYNSIKITNTINAWEGTLFSTQIPLISQILEQLEVPVLADISLASDTRSIYFETGYLSAPMKIRGEPKVTLQIKPKSTKAQLVTYLYDVDTFGTGTLITHGVYTLPATTSGLAQTLNFKMVTTAYDVPVGHRVVLAIDTQDPQYQVPTTAAYNVDFEFSSTKQSVLTIPYL